jgi:hypothetical protein
VSQFALVVLKLDFYGLERTGGWAALKDTADVDETEKRTARC